MCGIAGVLDFSLPGDALAERASRIAEKLRHRGPDGAGAWHSRRHGVALAHTRLALVDLAGGRQPMRSDDGAHALVYNGELYNFEALRDELASEWAFRTRGDAEVVLAALARWGERALERFEGMFALFYWNDRDGRGLAARDRLGVKPFVYRCHRGAFSFASEAKALLRELPGAPRANPDALVEYLAAPFFSGVERPAFEGLAHLAPGHLLRVDREGVSERAWFTHRLEPDEGAREEDLAAGVRDALGAAVAGALRADVPVGAFLSGGVDSTALATLASRGKSLDERPLCFTVVFDEMGAYDYARSAIVTSDDAPFARSVARGSALPLLEVPVARASLTETLAEVARVDDALPAWEQELAQWHLARAASRHRKAVLVGDAADETHYGYHFLLDAEATRSPAAILRRFHPAPVNPELCADPVATLDARYRALAERAGHAWETPAQRTLATTHLIVQRWLPRLLHNGDVHTMAHGLEARVPFADASLLALAARVPPAVGLRGGVEKALLRRALQGVIPEAIRTRKKSALPKDQRTGALFQRAAREALSSQRAWLARALSLAELDALADPERTPPGTLTEGQRAVLFRTAALAHWASHYGVATL